VEIDAIEQLDPAKFLPQKGTFLERLRKRKAKKPSIYDIYSLDYYLEYEQDKE